MSNQEIKQYLSPQQLPPFAPGLACTSQVERECGLSGNGNMNKMKQRKPLIVKDTVATKNEEVIERIFLGDEPLATITRSAIGSLILACPNVMFADIDLFDRLPESARFSFPVKRIVDIVHESKTMKEKRQSDLLVRIRQISKSMPDLGFRVYETAAGYRLLMTSTEFSPKTIRAKSILTSFGSDPLYIEFCREQQDFRARLTPKYWRCGSYRPPCKFPFADEHNQYMYRNWEREYHMKANRFAVCRYVESLGPKKVCLAAQAIIEIHDRLTILDGASLA
jgi:hypothetical protein